MAHPSKTPTNYFSDNQDHVLIAGSFEEASSYCLHYDNPKKCTSTSSNYFLKKTKSKSLETLPPEDMHKFWTTSHREKFVTLSSRSIVMGRVVNLHQLKKSQCNLSLMSKAWNLYLVFHLYGLEFFQDPIRMFYANLCFSQDSSKLETLGLGTRIF